MLKQSCVVRTAVCMLFSPLVSVYALAGESLLSNRVEATLEHVLITVPIYRKEAETALPVTVLSGEELRKKLPIALVNH